jgi:hypothetical protein
MPQQFNVEKIIYMQGVFNENLYALVAAGSAAESKIQYCKCSVSSYKKEQYAQQLI